MNKYKYPLQTDPFTLIDRIKASWFILKGNRLTMGQQVQLLERAWEKYIDLANLKFSCVATSSGSTANALLVETFLQTNNFDSKDVTVFCPSTTWASSVTPWIQRGCNIKFVDINLNDLSFDYQSLERKVKSSKSKIKVIWPTALIGIVPNVTKLRKIADKYHAFLFADLCEASFSMWENKNLISAFEMSTTSSYYAHELNSIEGGYLFINNSKPTLNYKTNALMIRNHGLVRSLPNSNSLKEKVIRENPHIDSEFLFHVIGTNYRMSDLHAYFGLLDFKRVGDYIAHRVNISNYFYNNLSNDYIKCGINEYNKTLILFSLPIISKSTSSEDIKLKKDILNKHGWETRPVIAFLPQHEPFKMLVNKREKFPNSLFLSTNGFYVGLNNNLTKNDINKLVQILN